MHVWGTDSTPLQVIQSSYEMKVERPSKFLDINFRDHPHMVRGTRGVVVEKGPHTSSNHGQLKIWLLYSLL